MPIIAPIHSWQYRRLLVLFVALVVAGLWFAYDGWLGWPGSDGGSGLFRGPEIYRLRKYQPGLGLGSG